MIHYHGAELTPDYVGANFIKGRHIFVSFAYPRQLSIVAEFAQSFALDNGAFTTWRQGKKYNYDSYVAWVDEWKNNPAFDWCLIPDKIDGDEETNRNMVEKWPLGGHVGVPVWHLHESFDYLKFLCDSFPRVALGSSGEYATIGTGKWWKRMAEAMNIICVNGKPKCKLHGLRMLNPEVFTKFPFSSADSTNVAQNMGHGSRWKNYAPVTKEMRAAVLADRIESFQSAQFWENKPVQKSLFCVGI